MSKGESGTFSRRAFLAAAGMFSAAALWARLRLPGMNAAHAAEHETFEINHSDSEWRSLLSPTQYDVLRHEGTERPFSSPLDHEKRRGVFACAGCDLDLFSSTTKFDSGTGAAAATSATFSTTVRRRPACATA